MINETIDTKKENRLFIRVEDSLKKKIEERAKIDDRTVSSLIRKIVKEQLEREQK